MPNALIMERDRMNQVIRELKRQFAGEKPAPEQLKGPIRAGYIYRNGDEHVLTDKGRRSRSAWRLSAGSRSAGRWGIERRGATDKALAQTGNRRTRVITKPELGTKRLCAHCGAKFYDLHHSPITCPKCDTLIEALQVSSRWRTEAARAPVRKVEPAVTETEEAKSVSLEDADAEAQGEKDPSDAPEAEDGVEVDDESLGDAAFMEEREDTDVTGDIEIEKGD